MVIPLYKGRGNRNSAASYRPVSLCHCLGKILEKIVHKQLSSNLSDNKLLHPAQHGFTQRLSTTTNLLVFDALITKIISVGHAYDIISFDFQKAFDKTHDLVIRAAARLKVSDKALGWLTSFLAGRIQRVRVGDSVYQVSVVTSSVIQCSSWGRIYKQYSSTNYYD